MLTQREKKPVHFHILSSFSFPLIFYDESVKKKKSTLGANIRVESMAIKKKKEKSFYVKIKILGSLKV